jgi:hypothetical protein
VSPGPFTLTASATVDASAASWIERGTARAPANRDRSTKGRLSESWTIRGQARVDGRPLSGWTVTLEEEAEAPRAALRRTRTSPRGRFVFTACAGESYALFAPSPGLVARHAPREDLRCATGQPAVEFVFGDRTAPSAHSLGDALGSSVPGPATRSPSSRTPPRTRPPTTPAIETLADRKDGRVPRRSPASRRLRARGARASDARRMGPGGGESASTRALRSTSERSRGRDRGRSSCTGRSRGARAASPSRSSPQDRGRIVSGRRNNPGPGMLVDEAAHTVRIPDLLPGRYHLLVQGCLRRDAIPDGPRRGGRRGFRRGRARGRRSGRDPGDLAAAAPERRDRRMAGPRRRRPCSRSRSTRSISGRT